MNKSIVICLILSLILNHYIYAIQNNNNVNEKEQDVRYSLDYCDGIEPNCGDN